jgi:hypothetical protein
MAMGEIAVIVCDLDDKACVSKYLPELLKFYEALVAYDHRCVCVCEHV